MPNPKDTLLKVKDLPSYDGLRLVDGKLIIPDAEIVLSESASHAPVNTLSKNHLNLGSGENTMYLDPATFTLTKDIPADVEQGTGAEYYKIQFDTEHNRILIYDTDRLEPKIQIDSSGIRLNNSLITGITSQSGSSTSLAASQSMVSGKQNQLTAGSNIRIVNDVISAVLTGVSNIIGEYAPTTAITGADGQLYLQYTEYAEPVIDPETGQPIVDPDTGETVVTSTYSIDKVYGWVDNNWYELNTGSVNLYGTTIPTSNLGENGSIYMQYDTTEGIVQVYGKINNTWYEFGTGGGQVDPELEKKVNELDDTAVRVSTPLTDGNGEGLSTISGEPITTKPKNDIIDLIENNITVTQIQTSGTEIAQVKIGNNTAISLYAPSGGGGTTVVPNPTGTAVADLNSVQIGNDIYSIPSGGGGNGYYKETELYSSASSSASIALSDNYTKYDALIFLNKYNFGGYILDSIVSTTGIKEAADNNCQFRIHCGSDSAYIFGAVTSNTQFALTMQNYFVTKVIGINYTNRT